jgi:hypothetical protein
MGRLAYSLINRFVWPMALAALAGCGVPQTAANLQYSTAGFAPAQPLIGSTPTTLSAEFGQPALLRVDGTAQVWLYHSSSCGLNLILYPDASGTPRVAAVSAAGGETAPADCTASLQQAHYDAAVNPPAIVALEHPASS